MVKYTVWNDRGVRERENTKFTRELNTYGVDENGMEEELLFPIRLKVNQAKIRKPIWQLILSNIGNTRKQLSK